MLDHPDREAWEVVAGNTHAGRSGRPVPHTNQMRHPRTAVGLDAKRTRLVILVVDGRKPGIADGMSYDELAAEMLRLGCRDAFNLDGGGSSVMAIRDPATAEFHILNEPTDGRERAVANVLGVSVENAAPVASPPKLAAARGRKMKAALIFLEPQCGLQPTWSWPGRGRGLWRARMSV